MVRQYRKFDADFKAGAVRLVFETGKPIAQVARDLGVNEGTLGNWIAVARRQRDGGDGPLSEDERAELARLRRENAELRGAGWRVGENTVAALMREQGLVARPRRRRRNTTRPGRRQRRAPDLI